MSKALSFCKLTLACIVAALIISSCEDFHENNGDFGGMWQLVEWRTIRPSTGELDSIAATQQDGIYYSVHQELIQFTQIPATSASVGGDYRDWTQFYHMHYAYFHRTSKTLTIYNVVDQNNTPKNISILAHVGVPTNGEFQIDHLSKKHMTLCYEGNILYFRKY